METDTLPNAPAGADESVWHEFCMIAAWEDMQRFVANHPREYNAWLYDGWD